MESCTKLKMFRFFFVLFLFFFVFLFFFFVCFFSFMVIVHAQRNSKLSFMTFIILLCVYESGSSG